MDKNNTCKWVLDNYEDCYNTSCGKSFCLDDGTLKENGFIYCYHCGKKIKEE